MMKSLPTSPSLFHFDFIIVFASQMVIISDQFTNNTFIFEKQFIFVIYLKLVLVNCTQIVCFLVNVTHL